MTEGRLVSIVIPTCNSHKTLDICLKSIANQTYKNTETICVDNLSTDGTSVIVEKRNVIFISHKGLRTSARNLGAKNAKGYYLLNLDSDMELTPSVVEDCVKVCEDQKKDAAIIPEISVGEGFWARCRSLDKQIYIEERGFEAARFMKKKAFDAIGGYDPEIEAGEDHDLHYRIELAGYKISRITSSIHHHEGQLTLKEILRKCRYYGRSMNKYAKKNKRIRKPIYAQLWMKKWKLIVKNPKCVVGLVLIKLIEFAFVGRHSRFAVLR